MAIHSASVFAAEDLLQFATQGVLAVPEVHDQVRAVVGEEVVPINGAAEVVPELRLNGAEQHDLAVLGGVVLVFRRVHWPGHGTVRIDGVGVERRKGIDPPGRQDGVGAGNVEVAPLPVRARRTNAAATPKAACSGPMTTPSVGVVPSPGIVWTAPSITSSGGVTPPSSSIIWPWVGTSAYGPDAPKPGRLAYTITG